MKRSELLTLVTGGEFPDFHSTVCLIRKDGRFILVDTGHESDAGIVLDQLAGHGIRPEQIDTVVLTHFHIDHVANLGLFRPQVIYMGEADFDTSLQLVEAIDDSERLGQILAASTHSLSDRSLAGLARMFRAHRTTIQQLMPFRDRIVALRTAVEVLPGVSIVPAPGHTRGQLVVWHGQEPSTCIASDAIPSRAVTDVSSPVGRYFNFDDAAFREAISQILGRADRVVPGHDTAFDVSRVIERNGVIND